MNEFGTDINVGNITNSCAHENDLISRQWLMECINEGWIKFDTEKDENKFIHLVRDIAPPAQPYTAEEIDKMQELESAQVEKAYELGRESAQPEEAIPISWIEAIIKKFMMAGDAFSGLTASIIRVMLNEWEKEQEGDTK